MRGDLKDAVGGGVDDRRAGTHVLGAELFDDLGARRRAIAQRAAADLRFELKHDLGRKPVGEERKRPIEMDTNHLPVPGRSVLSGGGERGSSERCLRRCGWRQSGERLDIAKAKAAHVGESQRAEAGEIA